MQILNSPTNPSSSEPERAPVDDRRLRRLGLIIVLVVFGGFGTWAVLALVDKILMLVEGQIAVYGDRDKVLAVLKEGPKALSRPGPGPAPSMGQAQVAAPAK